MSGEALDPSGDGLKTIGVAGLARVEGEAGLHLTISDGAVTSVQLQIYEPPRFFEALLRGRHFTEPPDITARVCGICPIAYQISACNAIEAALGVAVDEPTQRLRRLVYCGEWIESHVLHIALMHAPDFLGYESGLAMAAEHRSAVENALALKKTGNDLISVIGGRPVHPVNIKVGGFYRAPSVEELRPLAAKLESARDQAAELVRWVSRFDFPDAEVACELVALQHPAEYPITRGSIGSDQGLDVAVGEFDLHFAERQVPHSNALHADLHGHRYLTGPLARYSLNRSRLSGMAQEAASAAGLGPECRNPYRSIVVRAVEVLHACDEALSIIESYTPPEPAAEIEPVAGTGYGASEAPRGMLLHRYEIDSGGSVVAARIVPPTSQNQAAIEDDLRAFVTAHVDLDTDALRAGCERVIRNYDPCISCATHFLDLRVDRSRIAER